MNRNRTRQTEQDGLHQNIDHHNWTREPYWWELENSIGENVRTAYAHLEVCCPWGSTRNDAMTSSQINETTTTKRRAEVSEQDFGGPKLWACGGRNWQKREYTDLFWAAVRTDKKARESNEPVMHTYNKIETNPPTKVETESRCTRKHRSKWIMLVWKDRLAFVLTGRASATCWREWPDWRAPKERLACTKEEAGVRLVYLDKARGGARSGAHRRGADKLTA
jgi:hypothetical protein